MISEKFVTYEISKLKLLIKIQRISKFWCRGRLGGTFLVLPKTLKFVGVFNGAAEPEFFI